jgi:hypothetical protein
MYAGNYYFNMKLLFQYEIIIFIVLSMMYVNLQSPAERCSLVSAVVV